MSKKNKEFSIKILGSGTKKEIIKDLQDCILAIEKNSSSILQERIDREYPSLVLVTDGANIYTSGGFIY